MPDGGVRDIKQKWQMLCPEASTGLQRGLGELYF